MIETIKMAQYNKYKNDPNAPFGLYVEAPSSHLIVYFGSYNGEFRGNQTVVGTNSHGLFLRSRPANWYLDPEYALGETPRAVAATLNKFITNHPKIKTVTMSGFSMGAFAALLYSTWMPRVNVVMASAAQTSFPDYEVVKQIPVLDPSMTEFASIREVWERDGPPSNAEVRLQCCATPADNENFNDIRDAKDLEKFACVKITAYDCVGHKGLDRPLLADNYNKKFLV